MKGVRGGRGLGGWSGPRRFEGAKTSWSGVGDARFSPFYSVTASRSSGAESAEAQNVGASGRVAQGEMARHGDH